LFGFPGDVVVPPEPVFTVRGNVEPSPLVKVIVFELTEAVTTAFGVKEAVAAVPDKLPLKLPVLYEEVKLLYELVKALNEAVVTNEVVSTPLITTQFEVVSQSAELVV